MSFQNLSIRTKLVAAFLILTLLTVGLGVLGLLGTQRMREQALKIETNWLPSVRILGEIDTLTARTSALVLRHTQATDPALVASIEKDMERFGKKLDEKKAAYEPMIASPEEKTLYETFTREAGNFEAVRRSILDLSRAGQKAQAYDLYEQKGIIPRRAASAALDKLVAMNNEGASAAETDSKAVFETTRAWGIGAIALSLVISALSAALIVRGVTRGIGSVVQPMQALAAGDLSVTIPHQGARTEIGTIADAVQVFKDGLIRMRALEEETVLARAGAEAQRKAAMKAMADRFEDAVGGIISMVTSSATELQATAQSMAGTATQTANQTTSVAAAAEEAASNVNTVAAAAEELGSSVLEIGRQVSTSATMAQSAVQEAAETAELVQQLNTAVSRIGDVVTMITSIAGQTNLLALNATIEAARAGEAGRGFAVVAAEVKELANQTARATQEIGEHINQIQGSTDRAVSAIGSIAARIQDISGVATTIAAAVEEQGAATQEIVRNVAQAAMGTSEVTSNISGVAGAAEETGAAASQVLGAASDLSRQSEHLNAEVDRFLATVRAA
ncbi:MULTISPECIES: MCP four helix bundle domain-containing protein [unclassified Methylobacterium]|uniref:methyl-accepting chemotaxis protein n=1 Tax=unclassified Methylobacterium TaxID=2615210 RepID=UPI0006F6AFC6|nr:MULTISPECIES: MCP four helix bundle domain-containing protein [unclassified Methylobacterium]KQO53583.1 chemotaxis protein [Methylobacterium sp. Leaf86]KQO99068.1 chemotaxis protein [Methylobacterium sp. Leaf91]